MTTKTAHEAISISGEETFIEFLLKEARTHGYIEGMTDSIEQHKEAMSKALYSRINPFMKAYKIALHDMLRISADVRAQFDPNRHTISLVALMEESNYLKSLDNIYNLERAFENLLVKLFPSLNTYCIDISVITFSPMAPIDRNLVTSDFPYVTD